MTLGLRPRLLAAVVRSNATSAFAAERSGRDQALHDLADMGLKELPGARDQETVRSILGLLAIVHGARTYGRVLVEFSEDEALELEEHAFGSIEDAG